MSDDEFFAFCVQNQGLNIEGTSDKAIIISLPSGCKTSAINLKLYLFLGAWNEKTKLGIVTDSNGGFYLPNGAMRVPDVAWIPREKWNRFSEEEKSKFLHYCPDFVIELKSPSDKLSRLKAKMEEWINNGSRLGWIIDPDAEEAYVYRPGQPVEEVKGFNHELKGENGLPGFKLLLSDIKEL
jgi:Uma2 family endonuclease